MIRDMNLITRILQYLQANLVDEDAPIVAINIILEGVTQANILLHCRLLIESGYVDGNICFDHNNDFGWVASFNRITWNGWEYLQGRD